MKFKELKSILSVTDEYKISLEDKTDIIYYKIILDNQEVLITQHPDFAIYMFKFIRELTENNSSIQLIVGKGLNFDCSFISMEYSGKNLSKTLDKLKKV